MAFSFVIGIITVSLTAASLGYSQTRTRRRVDAPSYAAWANRVNPFIGTAAEGNTFPGATVPFGMVQWSPDTTANGWYKYQDSAIRGFSLTHFSGAGCPAYADIPFLPVVGPIQNSPGSDWSAYASGFSHSGEQSFPGYYSVKLKTGVDVQLVATKRTGLGVFTFPISGEANILINAGGSATGNSDSLVRVIGDREIAGSATSGGFCDSDTHYTIYFVAQFDRDFESFALWDATTLKRNTREVHGKSSGAVLKFDATRQRTVKVKVGISFVSIENAHLNLRTENDGWDLTALRRRAGANWNDWLGRIKIEGGSKDQQTIFYTALYHMLLHPNVFSDVNGDYIGFDNAVHNSRGRTHYANFSDWDTYRTVIQLHALLAPAETSDMMQSLVDDAQQSGWLPKWPMANDVTAVMGGDNPVPLITTAYAFGARSFDAAAAFRYMMKSATVSGTGLHGYSERPRLAEYLERGYVPLTSFKWDNGMTGATSASLEYVTDDFCIAQLAAALGDTNSRVKFMRRAQNWQNIFDPEIGFIRPRRSNGVFLENFDADSLSPRSEVPWDKNSQAGFEEGNTWQYTWMIPHNYRGLFDSMGGDAEVTRRLDKFFKRLVSWGYPNFNIGNEPSFVTPYAYTFAHSPWLTQQTVRRIINEIFKTSPEGLPGNDDLGATSGWYVWSALGLYPAIPGVGGFVISTPLFPRATIALGHDRTLRIESRNSNESSPYIQSLKINGTTYGRAWLPIESLRKKITVLQFKLGNTPNTSWAAKDTDAPPSFSEGQAPILFFIRGNESLTLQADREATMSLGARRVSGGPLVVSWSVAPVGDGVEVVPSSGRVSLVSGRDSEIKLRIVAGRMSTPGSYTAHVRFEVESDNSSAENLPEVVAEILVTGPGR